MNQREPSKPVPVYVVVFGSEKEYAPYRFNEFATAYYFGGADRDYIVLGRTGEQAAQIAVHEYVHLVARHAGLKFPPWLNEGVAELYSNLRTAGDKVLVGDLIPGRFQALFSEKWIPLSVILSAGPDSPYYNERNKAGSLYNEGWALVHMLQLSPDYVAKFSEFLNAVQSGADSAAALEKVYGKDVATVEKELQAYIRGNRFYVRPFSVKLANAKENFPVQPAQPFDVRLALADLTNRPGKEAESRKAFEDLAREDSKRPEPWANLGYLSWRHGDILDAEESFAKAYELGDRSRGLLWDFGRMAERDRPEDARKALMDQFELEPQRVDVRMELAVLHLNARRPGSAYSVLSDVSRVSVEEAPRFFTLLATAQIQVGDRAGARINIARLAANAKTPEDRARVDQMQRYLEQTEGPVATSAALAPPSDLTGGANSPPRLARVEPPNQRPPFVPSPEIDGSFVEFVCLEKGFKVVLDTAQGKKSFLIPDPKQVVVVGRAGGKVDLNCGAQDHPVHVKLEYDPGPSSAEADGTVKILYFE